MLFGGNFWKQKSAFNNFIVVVVVVVLRLPLDETKEIRWRRGFGQKYDRGEGLATRD